MLWKVYVEIKIQNPGKEPDTLMSNGYISTILRGIKPAIFFMLVS